MSGLTDSYKSSSSNIINVININGAVVRRAKWTERNQGQIRTHIARLSALCSIIFVTVPCTQPRTSTRIKSNLLTYDDGYAARVMYRFVRMVPSPLSLTTFPKPHPLYMENRH